MKISIFGLGYVGVVSAACLANRGHYVIGSDIAQQKVDMINNCQSPIVEKDLQELLIEAKEKKLICATTDAAESIRQTDMSIICVGTPSNKNGSLDTKFIESVCRDIGRNLKSKDQKHILVFRSTMLPGTINNVIVPLIENVSQKKVNQDIFIVYHPEFMREGTAVYDFNNPPKIIAGSDDDASAQKVLDLYCGIDAVNIKTSVKVAEMIKYVDNNFHALKITFANEIGQMCHAMGIDSHQVMDIFIKDTKLNLSPYYLKPGFAFGGSCLPKDLRAINHAARVSDLDLPLLNSLLESNKKQVTATIEKIIDFGKKKIGIAGFSFKAGTDDLRESPIVEIIETLIGKGYDIKLYDKNVSIAKVMGANKQYIETRIPHISSLIVNTLDELIKDREVIIIGNGDREFESLIKKCNSDQKIFDLVRIKGDVDNNQNYKGLYW